MEKRDTLTPGRRGTIQIETSQPNTARLQLAQESKLMTEDKLGMNRSDTIPLSDEEGVKEVVANSIYNLWEAVNNLTRLRPTKNERYRVTIFGSARALPGTKVYEEAKSLASILTEMDCDIITGGGPGLMQAANEGATEADIQERTNSVGIRVSLPFEQQANPFVEQVFEHGTFFTRLHHFVLASDAFIVTPGGIGTVLETMMIWQLLQVRHVHDTPLILIGNMWPSLIEWARENMLNFEPMLANPEDMDIPVCVESSADAIELIRKHFDKWTESTSSR